MTKKGEVRSLRRELAIEIGILMVIILVIVGIWLWALWPEPEIVRPIDQTIEKMAEEKGIPVIEAKELKTKEVIVAKDQKNFLELTEALRVNRIIVTEGISEEGKFQKRYFAIPETGMIIEFQQVYETPEWYSLKGVAENTVIFEKNFEARGGIALLASVFLGMAGYFVVLAIRDELEYRKIRKSKMGSTI